MIGFIIGAACAVGIAKMLRRRAWYGHYGHGGYGHACGPAGFRGMGGPGMRSMPSPARWALRGLFERLETTPGQERVILAALDELRENRKTVRDEAKQTRVDLAHAIEGGLIEDSTLEDAFARQDRTLAQLRVVFTEALKKVVEALDPDQRKELARWLEGGFLRRGWGGPGSVWA
jgi:uncharacterized membrane protein